VVVSSQIDGGAERYLRDLYRSDLGVRTVLLGRLPGWQTTGRAELDVGLEEKWLKSTIVSSMRRLPHDYRTSTRAIARAHAAEPFDVFHAQYKREQILLTGPLSRLAPVVWTEHGILPDMRLARPLRAAYRQAARRVHTIVCVSEPVAASVREAVGDEVRLAVVRNAVDLARFARPDGYGETTDSASSGRPLTVGVVARLDPTRRIDRAITAAAAAGVRLVVAGDGTDRARLEALARARRVEATFLGSVADVEAVYHAVDAVIFCALPREGFSMTLLEAAAARCPLIGFAEDLAVIDTLCEAGAVVLGTPEEFAAVDRARLARAAASAFRWVQNFDLSAWQERTFAVLAGAANDRRR
jgi:glycosyltransferase involved in cell wall biosynthesis